MGHFNIPTLLDGPCLMVPVMPMSAWPQQLKQRVCFTPLIRDPRPYPPSEAMWRKTLTAFGGLKYGMTKDYVMGLRFFDAQGNYIKTGSRTVKCATGYNIT